MALFLAAPKATAGGGDTFAPAPSVAPSPMPATLPSGVSEVMKMYKGGIPADIMISYINTSPLVFYLSADNIISLQQQGLPLPVINAMINRYGQSQRQNSMMAGAGQTQQPQYAAPQVQVPAQAPPPQYYSYDSSQAAVVAPQPVYPAYDPYYYDPVYYDYYPGYWGWPVGIGFGYYGGFGRGYGYGGFGHGGFGGGHVGGGFGGGHVGGGFGGGGHGGGGGGHR